MKAFSDCSYSETPLKLHRMNINENCFKMINENSNGLENFELSEESPQLFNDHNEIENETEEENFNLESDEEELEIPAFLRRQKN